MQTSKESTNRDELLQRVRARMDAMNASNNSIDNLDFPQPAEARPVGRLLESWKCCALDRSTRLTAASVCAVLFLGVLLTGSYLEAPVKFLAAFAVITLSRFAIGSTYATIYAVLFGSLLVVYPMLSTANSFMQWGNGAAKTVGEILDSGLNATLAVSKQIPEFFNPNRSLYEPDPKEMERMDLERRETVSRIVLQSKQGPISQRIRGMTARATSAIQPDVTGTDIYWPTIEANVTAFVALLLKTSAAADEIDIEQNFCSLGAHLTEALSSPSFDECSTLVEQESPEMVKLGKRSQEMRSVMDKLRETAIGNLADLNKGQAYMRQALEDAKAAKDNAFGFMLSAFPESYHKPIRGLAQSLSKYQDIVSALSNIDMEIGNAAEAISRAMQLLDNFRKTWEFCKTESSKPIGSGNDSRQLSVATAISKSSRNCWRANARAEAWMRFCGSGSGVPAISPRS